MKTKKQKELVASFLVMLGDDDQSLYREIILYLSELGYNSKKERSQLSFKHALHNKQIVKMGVRGKKEPAPFFALRFSACKGYSQRFAEVVRSSIIKFPSRGSKCMSGDCDYCAGEPDTHIYTYAFSDGEKKTHCGAYSLEIPSIAAEDLEEIKKLIKEEHEYLLKHEASA
ncbi:MAG: hypothetical protein ACTIOK_13615 [Enterococcus malodoratus]